MSVLLALDKAREAVIRDTYFSCSGMETACRDNWGIECTGGHGDFLLQY